MIVNASLCRTSFAVPSSPIVVENVIASRPAPTLTSFIFHTISVVPSAFSVTLSGCILTPFVLKCSPFGSVTIIFRLSFAPDSCTSEFALVIMVDGCTLNFTVLSPASRSYTVFALSPVLSATSIATPVLLPIIRTEFPPI